MLKPLHHGATYERWAPCPPLLILQPGGAEGQRQNLAPNRATAYWFLDLKSEALESTRNQSICWNQSGVTLYSARRKEAPILQAAFALGLVNTKSLRRFHERFDQFATFELFLAEWPIVEHPYYVTWG